jgi:nucleoside-diphosphate-sugar epimerase
MKIFVAGATGTLGIPLVRDMVCGGHEVTGLTRTEEKRKLLADMGAKVAVADALDAAALSDAVGNAGPELVIDLLTAIPKAGPKRASDMEATDRLRTVGTDNLLSASTAAGAKRIIAESMIFVYGYGDHGPAKRTENDALEPGEELSPERETVGALRYLESTLLEASRTGRIEAIVLRFGLLYGPDVPAARAALQRVRDRKFPVLRSGDGSKSWIHLDDAVSAIIAAAERGRPGEIYNIVDDEPAGYRDFVLYAARLLGAPRPRSLPVWFLALTSPYSAAALTARLNVSNLKAKKELGWRLRFPDYRAGLRALATDLLQMKAA